MSETPLVNWLAFPPIISCAWMFFSYRGPCFQIFQVEPITIPRFLVHSHQVYLSLTALSFLENFITTPQAPVV